jgi:hypothetical protein
MFLQCGIAAFALAVIFFLGPLVLVVAYTPLESLGSWWPWATCIAWIAIWAGLFAAARRENTAIEEWLRDQ